MVGGGNSERCLKWGGGGGRSLTLLELGGGVFHVNFVCLLITFLVLGRLPPNLVTFPKNYHSRGAWKKI